MRKQPAATPGRARQRSAAARAPSSGTQSACRNSRTSPAAWAAPWFIWAARPRGPVRTRSASGAASPGVPSVLPPSTTRTSRGAWRRRRVSVSATPAASFKVGMMTETATHAPPRRRPSHGRCGAAGPPPRFTRTRGQTAKTSSPDWTPSGSSPCRLPGRARKGRGPCRRAARRGRRGPSRRPPCRCRLAAARCRSGGRLAPRPLGPRSNSVRRSICAAV